MGLSVETVKAHLHKARAKLKAGLSSYFGKSGV
jgi:DNA-binding CsgD family transcriptional regulator